MELANPCYLVPSAALYRLAPRNHDGRMTTYKFDPNTSPTSRDKWTGYRVDTNDIGRRLLQILAGIEKREREMELLLALDQAAA
jgi:hypothetical protein